jgi:hypothetical protein
MERAMGIEYIALLRQVFSNQGIASAGWRCVRISYEKSRHPGNASHFPAWSR